MCLAPHPLHLHQATGSQARQLSRVLMIALGVMAVVYVLLLAGLGRGVPGVGRTPPDQVPALALSETQVELPGLEVYDDIAGRPVFSEDRQPVVKMEESAGDGEPEPEPAAPAVPLNIALTGIIHTPQMRIALMRDNATGTALSLQEEMFLPGDQGGWQVKQIQPLHVVFMDGANQTETTVELELRVALLEKRLDPFAEVCARAGLVLQVGLEIELLLERDHVRAGREQDEDRVDTLEAGYGVTVEAIVARSGVAKSTIYRHWETRDDVLLEVIESCAPRISPPEASLLFEDSLRALVAEIRRTLNDPDWARVLPALLALRHQEHGIAALEQRLEKRQERAMEVVLERGMAEGRLHGDVDLDPLGLILP